MEKGLVVAAIITIFTLTLAGCIEMQKTPQTSNQSSNQATPTPPENLTKPKPKSEPTPQPTPQPTLTPTPKLTPPPGRATPIPPGLIVMEFVKYYNERDAEEIYAWLSERVRANHSINDVVKELKYAEMHNITITPTEDLLGKLWHIENLKTMHFTANLSIKSKEGVRNLTVDFPLIYIPYTKKIANSTIVGETGYIDGWVFSFF